MSDIELPQFEDTLDAGYVCMCVCMCVCMYIYMDGCVLIDATFFLSFLFFQKNNRSCYFWDYRWYVLLFLLLLLLLSLSLSLSPTHIHPYIYTYTHTYIHTYIHTPHLMYLQIGAILSHTLFFFSFPFFLLLSFFSFLLSPFKRSKYICRCNRRLRVTKCRKSKKSSSSFTHTEREEDSVGGIHYDIIFIRAYAQTYTH